MSHPLDDSGKFRIRTTKKSTHRRPEPEVLEDLPSRPRLAPPNADPDILAKIDEVIRQCEAKGHDDAA
jgi:hypothetical protein